MLQKPASEAGGRVENVHTAYGDVNLCVFPDGSSVDLRGLYNGVYNGDYGEFYNRPYNGYYDGIYGGNNWYYWAYSWLNATLSAIGHEWI